MSTLLRKKQLSPRVTPKKPLESQIQKTIVSALLLKWPRALVWKTMNTGTFDPTRRAWRKQSGDYTSKGMPDICMLIDGIFFGLEVKRDSKSKPTDLQLEKIDHINRMGGHARVVWDWKDAINFVEDALKAI